MEELQIDRLLCGSVDPAPEVLLFWPGASKVGAPRANQESAMLWNALKRGGYEPGFLDDAAFGRGDYTNARALVLPRAFRMQPDQLQRLAEDVVARGIHVYANADLPGQFDAYHRTNAVWPRILRDLFGLDVSGARPGLHSCVNFINEYCPLELTVNQSAGWLTNGVVDTVSTWEIWHGVQSAGGTTIVSHRGVAASQPPMPALQRRAACWVTPRPGDGTESATESRPPAASASRATPRGSKGAAGKGETVR